VRQKSKKTDASHPPFKPMEIEMMQARMNHPAMVVPDAMKTLQALGAVTQQGLPEKLLELVHLRASQINGCSACVDMHPQTGQESRRDRRTPVRSGGLA
jgi:AhpD family alkylhydroperoxidase